MKLVFDSRRAAIRLARLRYEKPHLDRGRAQRARAPQHDRHAIQRRFGREAACREARQKAGKLAVGEARLSSGSD